MLKSVKDKNEAQEKRIAQTLSKFDSDPLVERMLDLSSDIRITLPSVLNFWKWDLFSRKAGLAYDGSTTLDMAVVLAELSNREAVIDMHKYESFSPDAYVRKDQKVDHRKKRFGKLTSLVSNQKTFKFSVRIYDENVKNDDGTTGDFRTFNITDFDGEFSESWKQISFDENAAENAYLHKADIVQDHTVAFNDFISPNRWTSFYGCAYWKSKLMIERLQAQIKHLKAEETRILAEGVTFPWDTTPGEKVWPKKSESKGIKVECFNADFDMVSQFHGEFRKVSVSQDGLMEVHELKKMLNNSIEYLRFVTRATEFSFYEYGGAKTGNHLFPAWINGLKWEPEKIKKTEWMMLHISPSLTLRYRIFKKKENVKLKFDDAKYEKA